MQVIINKLGKTLCLGSIALTLVSVDSCRSHDDPSESLDYKSEMREFVIDLSHYAKDIAPGFIIIPQNGMGLITTTGEPDGPVHSQYLEAIDGHGQEVLFYGYEKEDQATPEEESNYLINFLAVSKAEGNTILVTDYCSTPSKMNDSYNKSQKNGFISFSATERLLNTIPDFSIRAENDEDIHSISQAKNFLYLINSENFESKESFIQAVSATNYDLIIMDLFHNESAYTASEISRLKTKENGGQRLVICYLSIGEAEEYRYYWQTNWASNPPVWLDKENPNWEGNYKVKYWESDWQALMYGREDSYLKKIINAGFDGAYLDIIDAFQYYE